MGQSFKAGLQQSCLKSCSCPHPSSIETQQRYFSDCAILVAIASQTLSCLFPWCIAQLLRNMFQNGVSVQQKGQGGPIAPFCGSAKPTEKVLRDMEYHNDSLAISRDMGPLIPPHPLFSSGAPHGPGPTPLPAMSALTDNPNGNMHQMIKPALQITTR